MRWTILPPPWLLSRWWFQIFYIFIPIWGRFPFWQIFFKGVETSYVPAVKIFKVWVLSALWKPGSKPDLNIWLETTRLAFGRPKSHEFPGFPGDLPVGIRLHSARTWSKILRPRLPRFPRCPKSAKRRRSNEAVCGEAKSHRGFFFFLLVFLSLSCTCRQENLGPTKNHVQIWRVGSPLYSCRDVLFVCCFSCRVVFFLPVFCDFHHVSDWWSMISVELNLRVICWI